MFRKTKISLNKITNKSLSVALILRPNYEKQKNQVPTCHALIFYRFLTGKNIKIVDLDMKECFRALTVCYSDIKGGKR